jgi:hypothetical protein
MKFLAIEKENLGIKADQYQPYLREESIMVLELYEQGIVREVYFDQSHRAVIILECDNLAEVNNVLNRLPLVKQGLIHFEVRELKPYNGFSRI